MALALLAYAFVCMCVDCSPFAQELILSLAKITEENKHCLYYSNEYALENKLYNFPLTPLIKCQEWLRETCDI